MIDAYIAAKDIGPYWLPGTKIAGSTLTEFVLPGGWGAEDAARLKQALESDAESQGIAIGFSGKLESRRLSWGDRIRRLTLLDAVSREVGGDREDARAVCRECGVDGTQPVGRTRWTDRKLVDFQLEVLHATLIVVNDVGLDPLGQKRFATHIEATLARARVAVIALRHSVAFSAGPWGRRLISVAFRNPR